MQRTMSDLVGPAARRAGLWLPMQDVEIMLDHALAQTRLRSSCRSARYGAAARLRQRLSACSPAHRGSMPNTTPSPRGPLLH